MKCCKHKRIKISQRLMVLYIFRYVNYYDKRENGKKAKNLRGCLHYFCLVAKAKYLDRPRNTMNQPVDRSNRLGKRRYRFSDISRMN